MIVLTSVLYNNSMHPTAHHRASGACVLDRGAGDAERYPAQIIGVGSS